MQFPQNEHSSVRCHPAVAQTGSSVCPHPKRLFLCQVYTESFCVSSRSQRFHEKFRLRGKQQRHDELTSRQELLSGPRRLTFPMERHKGVSDPCWSSLGLRLQEGGVKGSFGEGFFPWGGTIGTSLRECQRNPVSCHSLPCINMYIFS